MPSSSTSYYQDKGACAPRPSTSSTTSSSKYAQSANSSRSPGSRSQTVIVHKPSGRVYDTNTSTSAGQAGYYY